MGDNNTLLTNGGRVLSVCAARSTLREAAAAVYEGRGLLSPVVDSSVIACLFLLCLPSTNSGLWVLTPLSFPLTTLDVATIQFDGVQLRRDIAGQILSAKRLEVCYVRREIKSGLRQHKQQLFVPSSFTHSMA